MSAKPTCKPAALVCQGGCLANQTAGHIAPQRPRHTNACSRQPTSSLLSLLHCLPCEVTVQASKGISGLSAAEKAFSDAERLRSVATHVHLFLQNLCYQHGSQNWYCGNAKCWQGKQALLLCAHANICSPCSLLLALQLWDARQAIANCQHVFKLQPGGIQAKPNISQLSCSPHYSTPSAKMPRHKQLTSHFVQLSPMLELWLFQMIDYR